MWGAAPRPTGCRPDARRCPLGVQGNHSPARITSAPFRLDRRAGMWQGMAMSCLHSSDSSPVSGGAALSVAVVGAGLAGCECALRLARTGIAVTLFEQKPARLLRAKGEPEQSRQQP